jgi:hypothetical protein
MSLEGRKKAGKRPMAESEGFLFNDKLIIINNMKTLRLKIPPKVPPTESGLELFLSDRTGMAHGEPTCLGIPNTH